MNRFTIALAGLASLAAVPAQAATTLFNETFEGAANNGLGQFVGNGTVGVNSGQDYKNVGFAGTDPAKLANRFAAFGGGNNRLPGTLLSTTINGPAALTRYTIDFDATYIGNPGANIADQFLLFTATDQNNNFIEANLQPAGSTDPTRTAILTGGGNIDTLFTRYRYTFDGQGPISLSFSAGGASNDNADVLLDNVQVSAAAVPEASTWAMLIIGFGTMGGVMRRRRRPATGLAAA